MLGDGAAFIVASNQESKDTNIRDAWIGDFWDFVDRQG